ncbi:hypothetical protein ACFWD7_37465 [Streptomyces mirabilis]|uniref:hypothetical protein n=1 Tax=Streptomyces mirabilis TaxID=68239 RepID=UPI0021BFD0F7|nr:hypothetical protein [Streptomyces mirabilis]MCT9108534.1 hypothetical protein [Streptomyces mirabilis]
MTNSGQEKPLIRVLHDESRRDLREPAPVPSVGELTGLAGDPRPEAVPRTLCAGGAGLPATGGEVEEQVRACQGTRATPV